MTKVNDLFNVCYPTTLVFGHQTLDPLGIPFVTSRGQGNGVAGRVKPIPGATVYPSGSITVPLKGTVLAAFVQPEPFYCAHQIAVLTPKVSLTDAQRMYYVAAIRHNKFRFNYGRQADRTFRELDLPSIHSLPSWLSDEAVAEGASTEHILEAVGALSDETRTASQGATGLVPVSELFEVVYGSNLELNRLELDDSGVNFVSRSARNNGVSAKVKRIEGLKPIDGGVLSVAGGGSVLETFYQAEPFYSGRDLYFLRPLTPMTAEELLYYSACLRANRYRYNYGRQANRTLKDLFVPNRDDIPQWVYGSCRRFVSSLSD